MRVDHDPQRELLQVQQLRNDVRLRVRTTRPRLYLLEEAAISRLPLDGRRLIPHVPVYGWRDQELQVRCDRKYHASVRVVLSEGVSRSCVLR